MDYPTLLLQLENQLQSLHKKGLNYINIEAMPKVKLKLLLDGLEEMMCTKTEITVKLEGSNYKLSPRIWGSPSTVDSKLEATLKRCLTPSKL